MSYTISTAKSKLNIERIHKFISTETYWGKGRTVEEVQTTIDNCLCFGMYNEYQEQIGFARVLTDYVVFAYLMDVIIFKTYQGRGYGKKLVQFILEHEAMNGIKTFALKTKDAQKLYTQFGFQSVGNSPLWMAKDNVGFL